MTGQGGGVTGIAIAQQTWYRSRANSMRLAPLKDDTTGSALSIEGARPFHIDAHWVIEPQGQLLYQSLAANLSDDVAAQVTFQNAQSLTAWLGARAARAATGDDENYSYAIAL